MIHLAEEAERTRDCEQIPTVTMSPTGSLDDQEEALVPLIPRWLLSSSSSAFLSIITGLLDEWSHWFIGGMNMNSLRHWMNSVIHVFFVSWSNIRIPCSGFTNLPSMQRAHIFAFPGNILRPSRLGVTLCSQIGRETSAPGFPKFLSGEHLQSRHQNNGGWVVETKFYQPHLLHKWRVPVSLSGLGAGLQKEEFGGW